MTLQLYIKKEWTGLLEQFFFYGLEEHEPILD